MTKHRLWLQLHNTPTIEIDSFDLASLDRGGINTFRERNNVCGREALRAVRLDRFCVFRSWKMMKVFVNTNSTRPPAHDALVDDSTILGLFNRAYLFTDLTL